MSGDRKSHTVIPLHWESGVPECVVCRVSVLGIVIMVLGRYSVL